MPALHVSVTSSPTSTPSSTTFAANHLHHANAFLCNTIIRAYTWYMGVGDLDAANELFETMPDKDVEFSSC
ncbi:hypothetical protein E2542_SST06995 [Spatholobus suberectus]|nr:hypothetical protein E2542_SST06995 [Spatholobus suberectus]